MVMPLSRADALQHVGRLIHLGVVEAVEAFVGEQQPRLRRERARELELLQRRGAEAVGGRAGSVGRPTLCSASSASRQQSLRVAPRSWPK